jgi:type I restriction enzyme, S subunit
MIETGDVRVDQIMPSLSDSWLRVPFEDCLLPTNTGYRKLKQKEIQSTGRIPVVDQGEQFIAGYTDDEESRYRGSLPVVIFGDHTRRVKYVDFAFAVGADGTKLLHPCDALAPRFFYYYLCALKLESQGYSRHYRFLKDVDVPVPALDEQRRIVAKLEELLGKVTASQKRLARIPSILERFRRSVLAAASSGRLTTDWRKLNHAENASAMVQRIYESREQEERTSSSLPLTDRKRHSSRRTIRTPYVTVDGDDLPRGWCRTRVGDIAESLDNRRVPVNRITRQGRQGDIPYYGANGQVGWIDDYLFDEVLVLVVEDETFLGRQLPFSYIIRGRSWVNNHAHVLRPLGGMAADYLNYCFAFYDFVPLTSGTTGRRKLTQGALLDAPLAVAPLEEQREIVRRVEALFKLADQIEARYRKAQAQVDRLTQSILAKAFKGELVPTEAELARLKGRDYEPASVLLDQLRAPRAT